MAGFFFLAGAAAPASCLLLAALLASPGPLVVSEIMFRPAAASPEWIELANVGTQPVTPAGWSISDRRGPPATLADAGRSVLPGERFVVAQDPNALRHQYALPVGTLVLGVVGSWPRLNNEPPARGEPADCVVVRDPIALSDSVCYLGEWVEEAGRSLERVDLARPPADPLAWSASPAGAGPSPGRAFRVDAESLRRGGLLVEPRLFCPAEGASLICLTIEQAGSEQGSVGKARGRAVLFDLQGHPVRSLWDGEMGTGHACVSWDGTDDRGAPLPSGAYVVLFEGGDSLGRSYRRERARLVLQWGESRRGE